MRGVAAVSTILALAAVALHAFIAAARRLAYLSRPPSGESVESARGRATDHGASAWPLIQVLGVYSYFLETLEDVGDEVVNGKLQAANSRPCRRVAETLISSSTKCHTSPAPHRTRQARGSTPPRSRTKTASSASRWHTYEASMRTLWRI